MRTTRRRSTHRSRRKTGRTRSPSSTSASHRIRATRRRVQARHGARAPESRRRSDRRVHRTHAGLSRTARAVQQPRRAVCEARPLCRSARRARNRDQGEPELRVSRTRISAICICGWPTRVVPSRAVLGSKRAPLTRAARRRHPEDHHAASGVEEARGAGRRVGRCRCKGAFHRRLGAGRGTHHAGRACLHGARSYSPFGGRDRPVRRRTPYVAPNTQP